MEPTTLTGPRLGRFVRYFNLIIGIVVIAVLAGIYWMAWRPLPQTSGEVVLPISGQATVVRDAIGVPHIRAATWEDAVFLQGYVTAGDRLWQMDGLRRLAAGELSEIVGADALQADREARMLRMRRAAEEHFKTLSAPDRAVLAAYARGVNAYIETHLGNLPFEFTVLGYDPRPWSAVDTILAGMQMHRNLTTTYRDELSKQTMLEHGNPAKVNFLFPVRTGREEQPGSNAWAISGAHTATGKPLLANDPHLEFSAPSTWYQVHLQARGLNVTGVSLPGVPCVIVGHNEHVAWGITNLGFDVQDLYLERMDLNNGSYWYQGQQQQARLERETIAVKGGKPVEFLQWITRHGPVMPQGNRALALRWTATEPGTYQFPLLDLNRASNWAEFTAALARFPGPGQNFVYADTEGNIGYHAAGVLPLRRGYDGSVPADGSSGESEWAGFIPFQQLPTVYNPPAGYLVTGNQNPFPKDYAYTVSGEFAPQYRSNQIRRLLKARNGYTPQDMLAVQKDVYSAFSKFLAAKVVEAYDRRKPSNPELREPVEVLRSWNGQMEKGTPAPMLISLIYQHVRAHLADSAAPGTGTAYTYQMAPSVVELALENGAGGFPNPDDMLIKSLAEAIAEGRKLQGSSVSRWNYGLYNELTIAQPVGNRLPLVSRYFNIGPVAMSGSSTTVKQTTRRLGPSMRFVADLSDWDKSLNNITLGESGAILSGHYKDQWDAYYAGRSFPMQFRRIDAKSTLTVKPR